MTGQEKSDEWNHEYQTRLGMACADQEPSQEQVQSAWEHADKWIETLENEI
jgi:hypothetical protein